MTTFSFEIPINYYQPSQAFNGEDFLRMLLPFVKKRGTNIKKPVVAICLATKERTEYSSTLECAKALHIDPKNIGETIKGNQKQSSGYTFEEK